MIAPPLPKKGVVEISPPSGIQLGFPWNEYQEEALPPEEGIDERAIRMLNKLMNPELGPMATAVIEPSSSRSSKDGRGSRHPSSERP